MPSDRATGRGLLLAKAVIGLAWVWVLAALVRLLGLT